MRSWVFYTECACQNSRGDTASYLKCTFDPISYIQVPLGVRFLLTKFKI
jgi:hypothetical protein